MTDKIKLINHSSVLIKNNDIKLLTDPWYKGSAFNDGWSLLYENSFDEINDLLTNLNYIFISHEHPDHFSIKFFKDYEKIIKLNKIKIIFQKSRDKRVEKFLKNMDFEMITLEDKDEEGSGGFGFDDGEVDALYTKAVNIVIEQQKVSTSYIQRYLQIGYNRAARIVEKMEDEGLISEANNAGKRQVLRKN